MRDAPDDKWAQITAMLGHALREDRNATLRAATPQIEAAAWWDDLCSLVMLWSFALIGESDAAYRWLQRVVELGIINYPFFAEHDPFLGKLRGEPRFAALMEDVRRRWKAFDG